MSENWLEIARELVSKREMILAEIPPCRICGCNWPKENLVLGICPNCRKQDERCAC